MKIRSKKFFPELSFLELGEDNNINMEKLAEVLYSEKPNFDEFTKLIENSIKNDTIGSDIDDYFAGTGHELTEDIENSKIRKFENS